MRQTATAAVCPFTGRTTPSPQVGGGVRAPVENPASAAPATPARGTLRRRTFLTGMVAALATAKLATVDLLTAVPAAAAGRRAVKGSHGRGLRGMDIATRYGRDKEARFGLMFKRLPAYSPSDSVLRGMAQQMNDGKAPLADVRDSDVAFDTPMPAGYIYFGQFVDHDITLDKTPLTQQRQDTSAMVNYDTPRFDLGSVYGGGPSVNPELYDPARPGYLLTAVHDGLCDLPRDEVGAAYLGDPRNDENLIVAQLHTVFLRLHNRFMAGGMTFEQARQQTRWHFQWLIVHDYLPRIVGQATVDALLVRRANGTWTTANSFYKPRNTTRPYIPLEFSGAAFRFGHSQIRAEYEVHDGHTVAIFARDGYEDLRGHRRIPADLWIDWNYFFDIPGLSAPDDRNQARRIDPQLSLPLATLPPTVVAPTAGAIVALAERNLLRGKRLGLPSGQEVAAAMGITPLSNTELGVSGTGWKNKAPLWFYVLREAELGGGGQLGPVGGRIVAEVLLGLLALDKTSYFTANPGFDPGPGFGMGSLILLADAFDPRGRETRPEDPAPEQPEPADPTEPTVPEVLDPLPEAPADAGNPEATDPLPGDV